MEVAGLRVVYCVGAARGRGVVARGVVGEAGEGEVARVEQRRGEAPRLVGRPRSRVLVPKGLMADVVGSGRCEYESQSVSQSCRARGDGWLAGGRAGRPSRAVCCYEAYLSPATSTWPAVVVLVGPAVVADEPTAATSGNCCLKLARSSSPGFCELVLCVAQG